jgi:hypothetical protein
MYGASVWVQILVGTKIVYVFLLLLSIPLFTAFVCDYCL